MKDIFVKTTLQYLAVEYHNYESHNYRKRQVFSLKCQWVILRHCLLFSHCYTEYIKLLQSPNEMYLYSQLSIAARVHIHTRQKKKKTLGTPKVVSHTMLVKSIKTCITENHFFLQKNFCLSRKDIKNEISTTKHCKTLTL